MIQSKNPKKLITCGLQVLKMVCGGFIWVVFSPAFYIHFGSIWLRILFCNVPSLLLRHAITLQTKVIPRYSFYFKTYPMR